MDEPVTTGSEQHREPTGQPESGPKHSLAWLWWLPIFVLFYVLSLGPAVKFFPAVYHVCPATGPVFEAIYSPLRVLAHNCLPFANAMSWYLEHVWHVK